MKILTCRLNGVEQVCVLSASETMVHPISSLGLPYTDMNELITRCTPAQKAILLQAEQAQGDTPLEAVKLCAPIPHPIGNVICLGENYRKHAEESYRFQQVEFHGEQPYAVYFDKKVCRALGDGEEIDGHLDFVTQLDYEAELAVILGRDASRVRPEDAADYIFGYSVANDVSARDVQYRHKQNFLGKSLDTFFAMGPVIVTADAFPCPPALPIRCWVNGELRQNSITDQVYFTIPHILSELSQGMTLPAGTILLTGTPAGVGMGMKPPRFLKRGDEVRCAIDGIGSITNRIG